jgi:hypothetical protein
LVYQLDFRASAGAAAGWSTVLTQDSQKTVEPLTPGTKYSFRSRGGYGKQDAIAQLMAQEAAGSRDSSGQPEGVTWGEWSVESSYVTTGGL